MLNPDVGSLTMIRPPRSRMISKIVSSILLRSNREADAPGEPGALPDGPFGASGGNFPSGSPSNRRNASLGWSNAIAAPFNFSQTSSSILIVLMSLSPRLCLDIHSLSEYQFHVKLGGPRRCFEI